MINWKTFISCEKLASQYYYFFLWHGNVIKAGRRSYRFPCMCIRDFDLPQTYYFVGRECGWHVYRGTHVQNRHTEIRITPLWTSMGRANRMCLFYVRGTLCVDLTIRTSVVFERNRLKRNFCSCHESGNSISLWYRFSQKIKKSCRHSLLKRSAFFASGF